LKQKSGARGLRTILETTMLDIMYEIPSSENIAEVVISEEVIVQGAAPMIVYDRAETA
jgi:ATP-dependent Clp protease ATP-binding subunit ClpX